MKPNVIFIMMDATRPDHLSCYGATRHTSPNIDALARAGALFENCFAAGVWTPPSHGSMFTGKYPSHCGVVGKHQTLDRSHLTMAEFLHAQGYHTGAVGSAWVSSLHGFDRGFEDFVEQWRRPTWRNLRFFGDRVAHKAYDKITRSSDGGDYAGLQWFKRWISRMQHRGPFFGFLRFLSAHAPYAPPPRFKRQFEPSLTQADDMGKLRFLADRGRFSYIVGKLEVSAREWEILKAWYDACIAYIDSLIGQLVEWLDRRRLLDSTLIIVTADHGEHFGEHGLADHQYCIYDTLLRVPLIVAGPREIVPSGTRVQSLVSLVDLFPSLARMIGAQGSLPPDLDGQSFFPFGSVPPRETICAEYGPPYNLKALEQLSSDFPLAQFDRAFKTIHTLTHKYVLISDGSRMLYDLAADPGELANSAAQFPELADRMHEQLCATLGGFTMPDASEGKELSMEEEEQLAAHLRSLGYL